MSSVKKPVDPLIGFWAQRRVDPRRQIRSIERFCEWSKKSAAELLEMQRQAVVSSDEKERFKVADLVQEYIRGLHGRHGYKKAEFTKLKSWFRAHRRKLPDDYDREFLGQLRSDRPSVSTKISVDLLRDVLATLRNDPRRRSMILTQFQSFGGAKELMLINQNYGHYIGEKIKAGESPIELEMKWQRKRHTKAWYTYLGHAAIDALKQYFDGPRGYPKTGEAIWYSVTDPSKPFTIDGYRQMWDRVLASLGYRPPVHDEKSNRHGSWLRYGVGAHELRTLAISLSQQAIGKTLTPGGRSFNRESTEYFAGHEVDDLGYRQMHDLDPSYRREQYMIVEQYLDPYGRKEFTVEKEEEIKKMQDRLEKLESIYSERIKLKE